MARAATTTDPFNAIGSRERRALLDVLNEGEATVGELVRRLGLTQPQVSKHLGVLHTVELVSVTEEGRNRRYRLNGAGLKPVHEWVRSFEAAWNDRLDRLEELVTDVDVLGRYGDTHEEDDEE